MPATCQNVQDVAGLLAAAHAAGKPVEPPDLSSLNQIVDYCPEDMTVTAQAGLSLARLQAHLNPQGQWLPVDPNHSCSPTLADVITRNLHGPRRYGCGTIRDHLIGIQVALPDGQLIRSGGRVVKNVAGFDLMKLFIGSQGTLGVVVEATFKLQPLPGREVFLHWPANSWEQVDEHLNRVRNSEVRPHVLDLFPNSSRGFSLVVGFAGTPPQVSWQCDQCRRWGLTEETDLEHDRAFWRRSPADPVHRRSVLPTRLTTTLSAIGSEDWLARAGNGLVCYRGGEPPQPQRLPDQLIRRVKATFDPKGILPQPNW